MKCCYDNCKAKNHENYIVKYGFRDGIQRYKCLNCNRTFIKQSDKKQKSLTENEKRLIDKMLDDSIAYRAIARCLNRALSTIQRYAYSKKNK